MRVRSLSAALAAAAVALAPPSAAAGPQIVDKADDANYLNDNVPLLAPLDHPLNHNPTPVGSTPAADILTVEWRSLFDRTGGLAGFTVTMTLKAPPTKPGVLYRAISSASGCSEVWLQYHSSKPQGVPQSSLRHTCDSNRVVVPVPAKVHGNAIVWTVELRAKSIPSQIRAGTKLHSLRAHSKDFVEPLCADSALCAGTQYDTTRVASTTYTVGEQ